MAVSKLSGFILAVLFLRTVNAVCPPNWVEYRSRCYHTYTAMTWADAKAYCEERGWEMLVIESPEENAFVHEELTASGGWTRAWLGCSDEALEDHWVCYSAAGVEEMKYMNWVPGQPDNYYIDGEHCLSMRDIGGWNDIQCHNTCPIVCETSSIPIEAEPTRVLPATSCYVLGDDGRIHP
ncbi:perlucin-like [Patiria miniata]|uniref:C-type lectin domain-containing protein n=1 Tax=Patiria miniata TaxID=46514 RepID=A0A914AE64_PATMI|nr:perlucin-like [Patiria miniata]